MPFLDGSHVEQVVERAMRPIALSRKNALFVGSDEGAASWAMLGSLIETLQSGRRQCGSISDRRAGQAHQQLAE